MAASPSESETARHTALSQYQILDTPPEGAFQDLVHLAAQIWQTPIALISFLDGPRHWVKAALGWSEPDLPLPQQLTDRALAQTLVIPDLLTEELTTQDDRPSGLRFYASVPLMTPNGVAIGILSVMDTQARVVGPQQVAALEALGRQTIAQLELRRHQVEGTTPATEFRQLEKALRKVKDELELRVAERTAELVSANRRLELELEERKRTQESLRVSQARFAGMLEIADDAVISVDSSQRITLFNQGAEQIFGYPSAEVLGQPLDILLPERFAAAHRGHVNQFGHASGQARRMGERSEIYGRRKDGREFPAEASISRLDLGGEKVFTVILRDITHRKQAEATLERLSRQNELILNSVGEGLCGLDRQGLISFVNPAAAKLLGYQISDLIGQPISVIFPQTHADGSPYQPETAPIYRCLQAGEVCQMNNDLFRRRDGSTFPVEYISTPIQERSEIVGLVITFRDITERQIVEKMKDEFISVVSHELRTPLTSIHGSLGLLASGLLSSQPEKAQRLLKIAVDSTDRLVRLINDILDIERIESGKVMMAKETCNITDLTHRAIEVMQPMADKFGVTLSASTPSARLWADPDRIIQTLTNLLSNAIKFSPQGGTVWLTARLVHGAHWRPGSEHREAGPSADHPADTLLVSVQDRGRGIPADKLETIFERFQQVDASDSRNHDGTGLGLAICRSILQHHQGHIWAESEVGAGSTFYFTLPILQERPTSISADRDGPLILLCDDDPQILALLQKVIEQQGYRVITVETGEAAIEQATLRRPDAIVLDLLLPGMNGWETMAVLKRRSATQDIPILICSVCSEATTDHPATGYAGWIDKPLNEAALLQSLHQALAQPSRRVRVLVIEDDLNLAQVISTLFEQHDIETFQAPTGREAIRLSQELDPDLLVLDLSLPDGDGFAVVEWLQKHSHLYRVPLVVYSARDLNDAERDRLHLGQTEFLTKGRVTMLEFEQRVMNLLHRITQKSMTI